MLAILDVRVLKGLRGIERTYDVVLHDYIATVVAALFRV